MAATFSQQLNHANAAVMKFAMAFWGKPRWAALMVGIANEIQQLENAACDVIVSRQLANATGPRLRVLARVVGQPVGAYSEADLRTLISVRIAINRSEGRWNDLVRVLGLLGISYAMSDYWPAALLVQLTGDPSNADLVAGLLQQTAAAGVQVNVLSGNAADGFEFQADADVATIAGDWGQDSDPSVGVGWMFVVPN